MAKKKTEGRGGARAGAGRPTADASGAKRPVTVWLTPAEEQHLVQLAGTPQDGVRLLIRQSMTPAASKRPSRRRPPAADAES